MIEFTLWDILRNLLLATRWTVLLSLVSFIGGGAVGLGLLFLRISKRKAFRALAKYYIELFQGTPLLMQLFIAFFGLGLFGIDVLKPGLLRDWRSLCGAPPSSPKSGEAASKRWRGVNGKPPPASAWGGCSKCATSSSRRR